MKPILLLAAAAVWMPAAVSAAEITTHVLDLARGVGGRDIPVSLSKESGGGQWSEVAKSRTDENGRVRAFPDAKSLDVGIYKLQFDMSAYPAASGGTPFFPEIGVVFQVTDTAAHYHVPVVVSPFGYSTYRGN